MSILKKLPLPLAFAVGAQLAAAQDALYFTASGNGAGGAAKTRSGAGASLSRLTPEDVAEVVPDPAGSSAEKFAPLNMWNVVVGDENGDGLYYEEPLANVIDAMFIPCIKSAHFNQEDLCVSTQVSLGFAGFGRDVTPGDLVWLRANGAVEYFMTETLIKKALAIPAAEKANIDAVAMDSDGALYLSFEADLHIGATLLGDGGIAMIPASALTWSGCDVVDAVAAAGFILASETTVDGWCAASGAADATGAAVIAIGDLKGLEIDPAGGYFQIQQEGTTLDIPNLLFSGENLTGGGILSTAGGGSIAVVNGVAMANSAPTATTGEQDGLAKGSVTWLNDFAIEGPALRVVLDTPTPVIAAAGDPAVIEFGGLDPSGPIVIGFNFGPSGAGGVAFATSTSVKGFPEYYAPYLGLYMIYATGNALGVGAISGTYPGGMAPGSTLVLQGITLKSGKPALSTPIIMQF